MIKSRIQTLDSDLFIPFGIRPHRFVVFPLEMLHEYAFDWESRDQGIENQVQLTFIYQLSCTLLMNQGGRRGRECPNKGGKVPNQITMCGKKADRF